MVKGVLETDMYVLCVTVVSRAFQILSDADKKSKYDKFGGDPDSRFSSASAASGASPFSGFASQRRGPADTPAPLVFTVRSPFAVPSAILKVNSR